MKLFYRKYGAGKPLFILHGLFGQSDNWQGPAKVIAEWGFEVYCIDLRNHGQSPHDPSFTYTDMVNDLIALINELQFNKVSLIGHSMGGKVLLELSNHVPQVIDQLVIVDIGLKYYPPHHQDVIAAIQAVNFDECKTRSEVERVLTDWIGEPSVRQFLMKNIYWQNPDRLAWRFNSQAIISNIDVVGEEIIPNAIITNSDFEAIFIRGEHSSYILDEDLPQIRNYFPDLELITIPAAGHWVHAEQPKLFLEELQLHLKP